MFAMNLSGPHRVGDKWDIFSHITPQTFSWAYCLASTVSSGHTITFHLLSTHFGHIFVKPGLLGQLGAEKKCLIVWHKFVGIKQSPAGFDWLKFKYCSILTLIQAPFSRVWGNPKTHHAAGRLLRWSPCMSSWSPPVKQDMQLAKIDFFEYLTSQTVTVLSIL